MSIERVVALLTPIFAAASGWLSATVAKLIPGVTIPTGGLTAAFVAGAAVALGAAWKWLQGRQEWARIEHGAACLEPYASQTSTTVHDMDVAAQVKADGERVVEEIVQRVAALIPSPEGGPVAVAPGETTGIVPAPLQELDDETPLRGPARAVVYADPAGVAVTSTPAE